MTREKSGQKNRTYITLSPELDEAAVKWAARLNLTKVAFLNMAVSAGISAVARAIAPEEVMTPSQWAAIIAEMVKSGKPVTLPDGTVVGSEEK